MITKKDFDVFIAYHGTEDVGGSMNKAREIYEILTERGLNCFFNPVSNPDGAFVNTPIIARHCKLFLLVANPTIPVDQWGEITEDTPGLYNEVMGFYNLFFEKRGIRAGSARVYAYGGLSASQANNLHIVFNGTAHFEEKSGGMKRLLDWISASLSMSIGTSKPTSEKPVIKPMIELKCPNCGAKLERKSDKLVCYACDSEFSIEEDMTTSRPKASVGEKPDIARLTDVSPVKPATPVTLEEPKAEEKPVVRGEAKIDGGVYKSYIGNEPSVTIPEGVTYIEDYAFIGNTDLKELTLPKSLKRIGVHAFSVCKNLCVINGGENLEHVMKSAFNECESLEDATFFSSLKEIGAQAFYGCKKLSRIVLPRALLKIGSSAFEGCERLSLYCEHGSKPIEYEENWNGARPVMWLGVKEEVKPVVKPVAKPTTATKPASTTTTATATTTTASTSLTKNFEIDGVKYVVKNGVLTDAIGLSLAKRIVLPEGIEKIKSDLFFTAVSLERITLPSTLKIIESGAFSVCERLERIEIPAQVKKIGERAFHDCNALREVILNYGLEEIGESAFSYCDKLAKIGIPGSVKIIANRAFFNCASLQEVILNDGIKELGEGVFANCNKLERLYIPATITKIGPAQFLNCIDTTIYCEASSKPIGWDANWNKYNHPVTWGTDRLSFSSITAGEVGYAPLDRVVEKDGVQYNVKNGVLIACKGLESKTELIVPEGIEKINARIFSRVAVNLKKLILPRSLKVVESDAFTYCEKLERVEFLGCEKIGARVFLSCVALKEVIFNDGLLEIGESVFTYCDKIQKLFIPASVKKVDKTPFLMCKLTVYCEVPSMPRGWSSEWNKYSRPVVWGAKREDAEGVATITTTKATKPEPRATVFTTSSRAVTPKTGVIEHMGAKFTVQNGVLTKIEWMGAKLRELHFPEGITEMKYCMLLKDPQLKRVVLPEGLKEIKNDTFGFACSIEEIVLPNSLETVGDRAFLRCENVKEFIFGDNITTLGSSVFTSCKNLEKVFLPKSLVNAGSNLFLTCPKLHVYCERTSQPTSWNVEWNKYKKPVTWGAKRPV